MLRPSDISGIDDMSLSHPQYGAWRANLQGPLIAALFDSGTLPRDAAKMFDDTRVPALERTFVQQLDLMRAAKMISVRAASIMEGFRPYCLEFMHARLVAPQPDGPALWTPYTMKERVIIDGLIHISGLVNIADRVFFATMDDAACDIVRPEYLYTLPRSDRLGVTSIPTFFTRWNCSPVRIFYTAQLLTPSEPLEEGEVPAPAATRLMLAPHIIAKRVNSRCMRVKQMLFRRDPWSFKAMTRLLFLFQDADAIRLQFERISRGTRANRQAHAYFMRAISHMHAESAVSLIAAAWRRCIADPDYAVCRARLAREFKGMM